VRVLIYTWFGIVSLAMLFLLLCAYGTLSLILLGTKTTEVRRLDVWAITSFVALCAFAGFMVVHRVNSAPPQRARFGWHAAGDNERQRLVVSGLVYDGAPVS
jgi:hypothetical protein